MARYGIAFMAVLNIVDETGNIGGSLWNVLARGMLTGSRSIRQRVISGTVLMCSASRLKMAAACSSAIVSIRIHVLVEQGACW
jgi:hypothetical protein